MVVAHRTSARATRVTRLSRAYWPRPTACDIVSSSRPDSSAPAMNCEPQTMQAMAAIRKPSRPK